MAFSPWVPLRSRGSACEAASEIQQESVAALWKSKMPRKNATEKMSRVKMPHEDNAAVKITYPEKNA